MLSIQGLHKTYEDGTVGVDGLDLEIESGEIFVLLGANGAGKTSTINMIFGFTEPSEGSISIGGYDLQKQPLEAKQRAAYVSENVALYGNFTAKQNLKFFAQLGGMKDVSDDVLTEIITRVGLSENTLHRRVRGFSKGMRQRLGIAIAILKKADLIVLDEPTSGLDPKGAAEFVEILKMLRSEGRAILMSSHDVFRARVVADRVGIMRRGQLIKLFRRDELNMLDLEQVYLECMESEVAGATSAKVA